MNDRSGASKRRNGATCGQIHASFAEIRLRDLKNKNSLRSESVLLDSIIVGIDEGKGQEVTVIDLRKIDAAICDYFVICEGTSITQTESIARKIKEQTAKQCEERPWKTEGEQNAQWILLDYFNIVVHVFLKETRSFYDIEELWGDGEIYGPLDSDVRSGTQN